MLLDEETLSSYVKKYLSGGIDELVRTNYNGGRTFKLTDEQISELTNHLESTLYQDTNQIVSYVNKAYNIKYSRSGMTKLLHKIGFSYKKPRLVPKGLNEESQEHFLEMLEIFMNTKKDDEAVLFYDSSHPQYCTVADYGWIKKGQDFMIPCQAERGRLNISGAIDCETLDITIDYPDKVNSYSTINMLDKIKKKYVGYKKVHIIMDNASSHKSLKVREHLTGSNINLVFLPPYSPNLNIIERLWGLLRKKVLINKFYDSFYDFKTSIKKFFRKIAWNCNQLSSLMSLNFQEPRHSYT